MQQKTILAACAALALCAACGGSEVETDARVLPLSISDRDGATLLAGTYDARTGKLELVRGLRTTLGEAASALELVVAANGEAVAFDTKAAEVEIARSLRAGDTIVVHRINGANSVVVAELEVKSADWTRTLSEGSAPTSFGKCMLAVPPGS